MTFATQLISALRSAATYNPEVEAAPACILWPDKSGQWQAAIPHLQADLPELLVLGDYAPAQRTGPAIWLRCALARQIAAVPLPEGAVPVLYLPGVSRQDLRAVESCSEALKPLAELQYRGTIWSQVNAKDWTINAFLKSDQGGLGLDVAQDKDTRHAMQRALVHLLDEELDLLRGKHLDHTWFNTLLTGGDPIRDLLQWLNEGDAFKANCDADQWQAFVAVCKTQFAFDPDKDGQLAGNAKLAQGLGPWLPVWARFREAPKRYPMIPEQLKRCHPQFDLFTAEEAAAGWPQWNDSREAHLRGELQALADQPAAKARDALLAMDKAHAGRRDSVWADLGEASLALAMAHLADMARHSEQSLAAGSLDDLQAGFQQTGWQVDNAVMQALACVHLKADVTAVSAAIRAVYLPWLQASARHLQTTLDNKPYPGGHCDTAPPFEAQPSDCVLFVDGLRFDTGKRLATLLQTAGMEVAEEPVWAALPSVTATGKVAVSPIRDQVRGTDDASDFEPAVATSGQSLRGGYHFKKLLDTAGWTRLSHNDNGNGQGFAWCEFGDIDHEGHSRGYKLTTHLDGLLSDINHRIADLIDAGWQRVRVVTDHGWQLVPGGLPKTELPALLTASKWGRCATIKPGADTQERLYPWYWNPSLQVALANGVSCYKKGEEYAHGGLSLQECLTLELVVTAGEQAGVSRQISWDNIAWLGLRCKLALDGDYAELTADIRLHAGDAASSMATTPKAVKPNGTTSLVVENEDLEGHKAVLVLLDSQGTLVAQQDTLIGGS